MEFRLMGEMVASIIKALVLQLLERELTEAKAQTLYIMRIFPIQLLQWVEIHGMLQRQQVGLT